MSDEEDDKPDEKKNEQREHHGEHRDWLDVPADELHLELKRGNQRNRRHFFRLRARGQLQ